MSRTPTPPGGVIGVHPTLASESCQAAYETILQLQADGVTVQRYQLTAHPAAFLKNAVIATMLRTSEGLKSLPATAVNGTIIRKGDYPSQAEIQEALS